MVVLDAMDHGLPAVCLDLLGLGALASTTSGRIVEADHAGKDTLTRAIIALATAYGRYGYRCPC